LTYLGPAPAPLVVEPLPLLVVEPLPVEPLPVLHSGAMALLGIGCNNHLILFMFRNLLRISTFSSGL